MLEKLKANKSIIIAAVIVIVVAMYLLK